MIKNRFYKSIFFRFVVSFLVVAIIPWTIFSTVLFWRFAENQKQVIMQNYQNALSGMSDNMDKTYLDIANILYSVDFDYVLNASEVKDALRYYLNQSDMIENAIFVDSSGECEIVSKENKYKNVFFNFTSEDWYRDLPNLTEEIFVTRLHGQSYFNGANDYVISFVKKYYHSGNYAGMIIFDLNINYFFDLYKTYNFENTDALQIVIDDICIYSTSFKEIDTEIQLDTLEVFDISVPYSDALSNGNMFYLHSVSDTAHTEIFLRLNKRKIFSALYNMGTYLWTIVLFVVVGIVGLAIYFSFSMYEPIRDILRKLQKIKGGNFEIESRTYKNNEFALISSDIDDMVDRLKKYIEKEYSYQIKQKQSELNALKLQIKPHYIYNTLEIIRVMAREEHAEKTCGMICSLANQLRYLLNGDSAFVRLKEEIDNVKQYIELTRLRYENTIDVTYRIDEDIAECRMVKITLQPIVENIFKHAIVNSDMELMILISAYAINNHIEVVIFDNGCGMDKEKADGILKYESESNHIGLKNVNERIKLLFGSEYGLEIQSEIGVGTLVKFMLPKDKME